MSLTGQPRVTLIVSQRERLSLSLHSLENILADRGEPFDLIYVDGGSAEPLRTRLAQRIAEAGFTLIRRDTQLWPNVARNLALPHVKTDYVVFIDNDVEVEPGWLGKLLACAEETGAAIVGPLYLWSDGVGEPSIHMAGGRLTEVKTPDGRALHERHDRIGAPVSERAALVRSDADFVEYHCMLVRTDFLRAVGKLSENVVCVHEHIDIALEAKARGLRVVFEPAAAVTQHAFAPYLLSDLAFHRWRWRREAAEASLAAFCERWDLVDDGEAMRHIRSFVDNVTSGVDPLVPRLRAATPREPLPVPATSQTLYGLLAESARLGYAQSDQELFARAYHAAMTMFVGGFRPCARPFINHCVGTASALAAFGFAPRVVVAGLLHATYSHAPLGPQPFLALTELERQLRTSFGERIERTIRRYARFQLNPEAWRASHPIEALTLDDVETIAIAIANEIDQCANGETVIAGKGALGSSEWSAYFDAVATALGVPAFAETLRTLLSAAPPAGLTLRLPHKESFRLAKSGAASMTHGAFRTWDEHAQAVAAVTTKRSA